MSTTTTRYGLIKNALTDYQDDALVVNQNANMDKIELELGEREDEMAAHKSAATLDHPDGSVTDAKIGQRTISDSTAPSGATGLLGTLLNYIGYILRAITGKANWWTAPEMSLETVSGKFDGSTGHKHSGTSGDAPPIPASGLAPGAATDTVIGTRTITDTSAPSSDTGTLTNLFSWLGYMIKAITGKTSWWTAPEMSLETVSGKFDGSTGHKHTGAAGDGPPIPGTSISVLTGVLNHGQQIPLPTGFTAEQCKWFVSPYELHGNGWGSNSIRDIYCYANANRIITCKCVDFTGYEITGKANYMIIGIK